MFRGSVWKLVVCGLALAAIAATGDEAPEASSIEMLMRKVDPREDDWHTEVRQVEASGQLERLARLLRDTRWQPADLAPLFTKTARATPLRPELLERHELRGGAVVLSAQAKPRASLGDVGPALREVVDTLGPTGDRRIRFKVVGITDSSSSSFSTAVRLEAGAASAAGVVQQTADWRIDWRRVGEGGPPLISRIELRTFDEISRPALHFSDRTAALLAGSPQAYQQMLLGGEYWHGRVDGVGEPNLMGHQGIAVGDANGDGLEDLYVAMGTGLPNKLLLRLEDGTVRDVAESAGVAWLDDTKGVLFADLDNDGDQDLLSAIGPTIVLGKNDGQGRFERFVRMRAPTPAPFYSLSVADYDLDGDLDVYGVRYVKVLYGVSVPLPFHDAANGPTNHLLRNDGNDRFSDVTLASGLGANNTRFSLAGVWADYDDDGDPDLYVTNDFGRNNLYRNDGGRFVDVAEVAGAEDQAAGMGASWADYDLDGDLDLYVTNMFSAAGNRVAYQPRFQLGIASPQREQIRRHSLGNTLLANQGNGTFRDVSDEAGVRMGRWAWGAKFADLDNDGYEDLVVPNGFLTGAVEDDL